MHNILYSDKLVYTFVPLGYFTYYLTDFQYYNVSNFIHYSSLLMGAYFTSEKFIPGALFFGFHLAHHSYLIFYLMN